ncbi:hypothetical protein NKJ43_30750 [Mesorhizobium sp. M0138]
MPLFIDCELGKEFDEVTKAIFPLQAPRYAFLCNYQMGLEYVRRRGGMIFVPPSTITDDLTSGRLCVAEGAPPIPIPLYGAWLPVSPARSMIDLLVREYLD